MEGLLSSQNIEDAILENVYKKNYTPKKIKEFFEELGLEERYYNLFSEVLNNLINECKILISKKRKVMSLESMGFYRGTFMSTTKKFGFVKLDQITQNQKTKYFNDIFIPPENTMGAINGDEILVYIHDEDMRSYYAKSDRPEADVQKIIKRNLTKVIGTLEIRNGNVFVTSKKGGKPVQIFIKNNNMSDVKGNDTAELNDLVEVEIISPVPETTNQFFSEQKLNNKKKKKRNGNRGYYNNSNEKIYGRILNILGQSDSIYANYEAILTEHDIRTRFDKKTLIEADAAADINSPQNEELRRYSQCDKSAEKLESLREDLRDKLIFSIDGEDSKDLDDTVSLDTDDEGNYILGVHIADVSNYVLRNSLVDKEAYERGTSVYFADKVVPMLPFSLSNGICSLNENVDRLCVSAFMTIDKNGKTISSKFVKSVINSKIRGIYSEFNFLFKHYDENKTFKPILLTDSILTPEQEHYEEIAKKYKPILKILPKMRKLSSILKKHRTKRGALELESTESKFIMKYDEVLGETRPVDIKLRENGEAENLIEEFMLCANEAVAAFLYDCQYPAVYRVHEKPAEEKIISFIETVKSMGITVRGLKNKDLNSKMLQKILDKSEEYNLFPVVNTLLLRSMAKAKYSHECIGHYGLACEKYLHFTSPIRRYPDLTVHRILKDAIDGKNSKTLLKEYGKFVKDAGIKSSEREVCSLYAERDIEDLFKCAYMHEHIGEEFEGTIRGVTSFGFFVGLENTCEGLVRISELDGYYEFNKDKCELTYGKNVFKIGQKVKIKVTAVSIETQTIDFSLIYNTGKKKTNGLIDKYNENNYEEFEEDEEDSDEDWEY